MAHYDPSLLHALPLPALLVRDGRVCHFNPAAGQLFDRLGEQAPVPDGLPSGPDGAGLIVAGGKSWHVSVSPLDDQTLFLFQPARLDGLSHSVLEGTVRRLHEQLGQLMLGVQLLCPAGEEEPPSALRQSAGQLSRSLCQMLRLVGHLDLLREFDSDSYLYVPITLDLVGLCAQVCRVTDGLLKSVGQSVSFSSPMSSLLVRGDSELLQRLLVELIANASRTAGSGGSLTLSLAKRDDRAILTLSGQEVNGGQRPLSGVLSGDLPRDHIPLPGDGAGLGMLLIQQIITLHQGTLLMERQDGVSTTLALPLADRSQSLPVRTPTPCHNSGFPPELVGLSDLLPAELFIPLP